MSSKVIPIHMGFRFRYGPSPAFDEYLLERGFLSGSVTEESIFSQKTYSHQDSDNPVYVTSRWKTKDSSFHTHFWDYLYGRDDIGTEISVRYPVEREPVTDADLVFALDLAHRIALEYKPVIFFSPTIYTVE